jgi:hypothetical protein
MSFLHLLTFQSPIYRLQSNSFLITFQDADPEGRHLKCKKVYKKTYNKYFIT